MKTLLVLLFLLSFTCFSQLGTLHGTITDAKTGEFLPFIRVILYAGSDIKGGVQSDFDGEYKINAIDPGVYSVVYADRNYSGYRTDTLQVTIEADRITFLDIQLEEKKIHLSNIEVKAVKQKSQTIRFRKKRKSAYCDAYGSQAATAAWMRSDENRYNEFSDNTFVKVKKEPLSTFSIDVDKSAYTQTRRDINNGRLPDPDLVRIEEFINYFQYDYPQPEGEVPFSVTTEYADCPWNKEHKLALIGIQGELKIDQDAVKNNLVFLIDVSGSMEGTNRLDLVKSAMKMLVKELKDEDRISIVTYSGHVEVALESTRGTNKKLIEKAINQLRADGSTNGSGAIQEAYRIAEKNFKKNGNNRIILATDGDFNVGVTDDEALIKMIEEKRENGVYLSVLGVGDGNFQDAKMEQIADHGNGNYFYLDNLLEAKRTLVTGMMGLLYTIAKDVKLQVEFNPTHTRSYRLIGYVNRKLEAEDFNDDKKDAGELGAGHTVTAIYELVPIEAKEVVKDSVDPLRYQQIETAIQPDLENELFTVNIRYKDPNSEASKKITHTCSTAFTPMSEASENMRFASAVVEFGLLLRNSEFKGDASFENTVKRAKKAKGEDDNGIRAEFIRLVQNAELLDDQRSER